jgi:hypothetical protein
MKNLFLFLLLILVINSVEAQFGKVKKNTPPPTNGSNTTQTPTNAKNGGKKNNSKSASSTLSASKSQNATKKLDTNFVKPQKRFDTIKEASGRDYITEVKPSRRNNYAYKKESVNDRQPLPYDDIREDDATYSQFIWREIDAREKMNLPFLYSAKEEGGDQRFFSILLNAIKNDDVVAFDAVDDRFTTPLTFDQVV